MKTKQTTIGEDTKHEELRSRLDKIAETVKAASLQKKGNKQKKAASTTVKPTTSPRSPRRGPEPSAAGPFHGNRMWGLGACSKRMSHAGKPRVEGAKSGRRHSKGDRPGVSVLKNSIKANATLLEADRYLNPDPLVRLIGETNETQVKLEGQNFTALIDLGAVVSQITESLATTLGLKIRKLKTILPIEGAAGVEIPYLGYVEAFLEIPEVSAFKEDCLLLVMPDHEYGERVPITVGTLHIDLIIERATLEELEKITIAWGRGQMFRKLQTRQAQLMNAEKLSTIEGVVKLTQNVKLKAGETLKIDGRSSHQLNDKRVNVIVEPSEENGEYTIPSYTYL